MGAGDANPKRRGWHFNAASNRLEFYFGGTMIGYINSSGLTVPTLAITAGSTVSNGGITGNLAVTGKLTQISATESLGYATGSGSTVTQGTGRTTGVTIDTPTGAITLVSAAGSTTPASFTVTCAAVKAGDVVVISQKSGTDKYDVHCSAVADGSFQITSRTMSGTTTEQPVFNYAIIKGVAA